MEKVKYLILGHGYTAQHLIAKIKEVEPNVAFQSTSRKGSPRIEFNLDSPSTWDNLPPSQYTIWTFPPEPSLKVKEFWKQKSKQLGKLIVVGSTGSILATKQDQKVDENTPLDLAIERAKGEIFLKNQGAVLVLSAGIYGLGCNPLDWIKKGLVGKSKKWVNMVHVEDLVSFLLSACERGTAGKTYIASDGNPQQWEQVIGVWEKKGLVKKVPFKESNRISKLVNNSQSIKELQVDLKHRNFADSVS